MNPGSGSWLRTIEVSADYPHPDVPGRWHITCRDSGGLEYEIPLQQQDDGSWKVVIDNSDIVEVSWLVWK